MLSLSRSDSLRTWWKEGGRENPRRWVSRWRDSLEELAYGKVSQGPPRRGVCTKVGVQEASRAGLLEEVSSAAPSTSVAGGTLVPTHLISQTQA